ncbi:MAG TPA: molybdopterin molybdenumtransferase MoeA, partial [Cupriavidus sp.]|nr:molybdopterin molybdenumtransferase MoeA [Cupriavidus sp.]
NHVPASGEWIRRAGEDIEAGSEILPAGTRLSPQALGLAASVGQAKLDVVRRVRVAVFFTGDELAMPGEPLKPGAIYNSNRFTLRGLLENLGCEVTDFGIVPDTLAATRDTLRRAAEGNDLIITSGGVSVGEEDHIRPAVTAEGRLDLWQIAIKPGKPLAFGQVANGTELPAFFLGLPGNPVSSFVTFLLFVRPFILRLQGVADVTPRRLP